MKFDFSTLSSSDLDGVAALFERVAMMERAPELSRWGEQIWVLVNSEIAARLDGTPTTPATIELDHLGNEQLVFLAALVTGVMDAGTEALVGWVEAMCIGIAGELNRRAKHAATN